MLRKKTGMWIFKLNCQCFRAALEALLSLLYPPLGHAEPEFLHFPN